MSSIPLPALHINPPQQPDTADQIGKILQLKNMMQQGKMQGLQLQQEQMQVDDQKKWRQAFMDAQGDPEKTLQGASKLGVSPDSILKYKTSLLDQKQKLATLGKDQLENQKAIIELADSSAQRVLTAAPEDRPAVYANERIQLLNSGQFQPQDLPEQYPGDEFVKLHAFAANAAKKQIAETEKSQSEAQSAHAGAQIAVGSAKDIASGAGLSEPVARKKNLQFEAGRLAEEQRHNKAIEGALNDQGLDIAAENYAKTGTMPAGMRSAAMVSKIINRAAQLHPTLDVASNKAEYDANRQSLENLQKQRDTVVSFENTALKNLDQFLQTAKGVVDYGGPMANTPLRALEGKVMGEKNQAAFNAARQIAINEIAKVTNNPTLAGQLSDNARHEVESLVPPNATISQIYRVAQILKQDMANRHESYDLQISDIKNRIGGKGSGQNGQPQSGNGAPSGMTRIKASDGSLHDIPSANLQRAKQIDPGLQVVQ